MFFPKNLADALRTPILYRRATRGRRGGRPPLFFLKIKKSALILEKKALIASILVLNLLFKM